MIHNGKKIEQLRSNLTAGFCQILYLYVGQKVYFFLFFVYKL